MNQLKVIGFGKWNNNGQIGLFFSGKIAIQIPGKIKEFTYSLTEVSEGEIVYLCKYKNREFFKFQSSTVVSKETGKPFYNHFSPGKQILIQAFIQLVDDLSRELSKTNDDKIRFNGFVQLDTLEDYQLAIKKLKSM